MCSNEDIKRRSILANLAFQNYKKVWEQGKRIPLKTRLKIYEAQVVSVLMYNCSCWAASKQLLNKLDICHRKHLRQIIRMTYPNVIKNDTLYKRCSLPCHITVATFHIRVSLQGTSFPTKYQSRTFATTSLSFWWLVWRLLL